MYRSVFRHFSQKNNSSLLKDFNLQLYSSKLRLIATQSENELAKDVKRKGKKTSQKDKNKRNEFDNISPIEKIKNAYPSSLWSRHKHFDDFYLVDTCVAESVAKAVTESLDKHVYVFEANPGPGILSKALLEAGVARLRVFEKEPIFIPALKMLDSQYPSALDIIENDLILLPKLDLHYSYSEINEINRFYHGVQECAWKDEISIKILAVISSSRSINFMRYILAKMSTMSSVFVYGRCQFFLLMTQSEYECIKAIPKENLARYRWATVLYNLFFEIEYLEKFPIEAFLPQMSKKNRKRNLQHLHFIKLTPRVDLFETIAPQDKLPELYFFIRRHLLKRTSHVIPSLEQWVPFCGPKFIKEGMNVFTKFGDLSPVQILQLFHQFISLPEYEDSLFHNAARDFFENKQFQDEENGEL